jgi:hypothetical protein
MTRPLETFNGDTANGDTVTDKIRMSEASASQGFSTPRSEQITLSALGLEQASVVEPDSFVFVVGDEEYRCSRFQAAFLSKAVSDLFVTDAHSTEFVIDDIPDPDHDFRSILNVLQHGTLEVTEQNLPILLEFAHRLKCEELGRALAECQLGGHDLNSRNAVSRLLVASNRLLPIDDEVEFIASRLDEIESLDRLPPSLLEIVLESVSLRIETEDWLLELICGLGNGYEFLIRYVRCEFLSSAGIDRFIEAVEVERIDALLWTSVCHRLTNTCSSSLDPQRFKSEGLAPGSPDFEGNRFPHGSSDSEGILHHLTEKYGENNHWHGWVAVTASGTDSACVEAITSFGHPSYWFSTNAPHSWVMFDFKDLSLCVDGYSLNSGSYNYSLRTWEMEVSNDGSTWVTIDRRSTKELRGTNVTRYFACNEETTEFYRYVRIRQTGVNQAGTHNLEIGHIEFFGQVRGGESVQ